MIQRYYAGAEIVYGVRSRRDMDAFFKRSTADAYYRVLKFLGIDIVSHHADFRLISRRAAEAMKEFPEVTFLFAASSHNSDSKRTLLLMRESRD